MNCIIIGPQGSGKSTQAELLSQKMNLPHLQTGSLYRRIKQRQTVLGRRIKLFLDKGQLVPDKDHNQILAKEVVKSKYRSGFVLDGSPRTLSQAKTQPFVVDKVFYLRVGDKKSIKRLLKRKRIDDTPALIAERLRLYHQETEPVLEYYRQKGILVEIDGEQSIEAIHQEMMKIINNA